MTGFILLAAAAALGAPATEEDVVVTATGAEQPADQVGQAITVITREDLDRRQTVSLSDFLLTTPGVTVSRNGGTGSLTAVRIRGAEGDQTLTLIDGVRVNDPSSPGGGFDFANLLAGSIERVEVLRGPNSVPWGSQAIGGVVNVITAQPSETFSARGTAEYGYADSGYATAGLTGGSGIVKGSLNGGYLRTDGISAAASGTERDGYRQYGATGRLVVEPIADVGIDLRGYYANSRLQIDGFPAPRFTLADTPEYSKAKEFYGYAGAFANLANGRFRNRVSFTLADINRDNFNTPTSAAPAFFARGRSERYEYRGDFAVSDAIRLVGGAEREDSKFNDGKLFASTGITSFHGQAIVRPVSALTLTAGVRHDDHDDFGNHTTFGANGALVLGGTTIRANYAEGFKAPTLFQLFSSFGTRTLQPETARSYDVGAEQSLLGGAARIGVTYFARKTNNQIDFDSGTFTYRNIARTRGSGVEATLSLHPSDRLAFEANYTRIDAENRSPGANFGRDLARRPQDSASVSADWQSPVGVNVGGTVTMVGDSFDDLANRNRIDGYAITSLRAELPIGERLALYGRVENLFDAGYQTVAGYGTYGRAAYAGVRVRLK